MSYDCLAPCRFPLSHYIGATSYESPQISGGLVLPSIPPARRTETSRSNPHTPARAPREPYKKRGQIPFFCCPSTAPRLRNIRHILGQHLKDVARTQNHRGLLPSCHPHPSAISPLPSAFSCHGNFIQTATKSLSAISIILGKPALLFRHRAFAGKYTSCRNLAGILLSPSWPDYS